MVRWWRRVNYTVFRFTQIGTIQLPTATSKPMAKHFCMDLPCPFQSLGHLSHRKGSSQQLHHGQPRGLLSNAQAPHTVSFRGFACTIDLSEENKNVAHEDELFIEFQSHSDLIDSPFNFSVQDKTDE
jgi:hypothetical protein